MFNKKLSKKAHDLIDAQPKACWKNAILALLTLPDLAGCVYVEGWIISLIVIEHGWLEMPNGDIVDPTLIKGDAKYFPGVKYTAEQCEEAVSKGKTLPLVYEGNGFGGFRHVGYLTAHNLAFEHFLNNN